MTEGEIERTEDCTEVGWKEGPRREGERNRQEGLGREEQTGRARERGTDKGRKG